MGIFRRSLGEDTVDYYNHTWSVLFLLILAIVMWLLPLSLYVQHQNQHTGHGIPQVASREPMPRFTANCWCPVGFTDAMVAYSQEYCSVAYNLALQGIDPESSQAKLFNAPYEPPLRTPLDSEFLRLSRKNSSQTLQDKVMMRLEEDSKWREKSESALHFIHTTTPFALFLLAICLKIPHLVWTLLSTFVGGINIDQTLMSARVGTGLSYDSRRQLLGELAGAAAEKMRRCSWMASSLYLLLKFLMCVAVIAELVVVHRSLLPQAQSLENDLEKFTDYREKFADNRDYSNKLLLCDMPIRQLQDIQMFTLQCIFQADQIEVSSMSPIQNPTPKDHTATPAPQGVMKLYVTIYLIVQTFLIILTLVNMSSFLVWLMKLVAPPCRKNVVSDLDLPADACLLLQMAQENTGPEIVIAFSQSGAWSKGDGKESIE